VGALIAELITAGVEAALVGRVAAALSEREAVIVRDESADRRRERDRERKRLRNPRNSAESAEQSVSPEKGPQTPKKLTPSQRPPSPPTGAHGSKTIRLVKPSDFDRWYDAYPLHLSRGAAEKAFPKALAEADLETLIAGAESYAERKRGVERQFVAYPATWLRAKGWLDEPEKPPTDDASRFQPQGIPEDPAEREQRMARIRAELHEQHA
jgi:hypothetical protein